jgi:acylphosphatase
MNAQEAGEIKTIEVLVAGRVQKVGFRACVRKIAANLGITGEVMNLEDGRVLLVASGEAVVLEKLTSMLYSCPRAVVREIRIRELPLLKFSEFEVVRGLHQYMT